MIPRTPGDENGRERAFSHDDIASSIKGGLVHRAELLDLRHTNTLLKKLVMNYADIERSLFDANTTKNTFLGIAAHDLRNPLTTIGGFCDILLEDETTLTTDQREMITIIHEAGEHMLSLVNDLLDVAAIEQGKLNLVMRTASLETTIQSHIHLNDMMARKKSIVIIFLPEETPTIAFDPERIGQVLDNLLSNAIKYSPPGSTVHVTLQEQDGQVLVSVRDEGPGISADDQVKLFGAFQKLTARPTGGERSTGLGLAIVKKIVDAHNGSVTVTSVVGQGSVFTVALPVE